MPVTRRQKRLGLNPTIRTPIEVVRLAVKIYDELKVALKRQDEKDGKKPSILNLFLWLQTLTADEFLERAGEGTPGNDIERTYRKIVRSIIPYAPDYTELQRKIDEYETLGTMPKISTKLHRFIRIYEENKVILQNGC
jgi:hypothetical protein